jgi:hypothetical protein
MHNSFVNRHTGAQRENEQRDNKTPEIELATVAEWVRDVGLSACTMKAIKKEDLVAGIDERMNGFAQHCRTASPKRRCRFRQCDQKIPNKCSIYDRF